MEYKKYGINRQVPDADPYWLLKAVKYESKAETLLKAKQYALLSYMTHGNRSFIEKNWPSIRICMRNKYVVKDVSTYRDYLQLLDNNHKDLRKVFYLAFSGEKDSQALYHLSKMARVKFKAHMNLTSVDPPEVIRFVKMNYPDVELIKPTMSIYDVALKKHLISTRTIRWCCAEFKEMSGAGKVTLIGIRKAESVRCTKREEIEISSHKFSGNFD